MSWRGACEKRPEFFSIFFSALTDKDDFVMDWQCGVGMFVMSLFFILVFLPCFFSFHLSHFPFIPIC